MDSVRVLYEYTHMGMAADGRYVAAIGRAGTTPSRPTLPPGCRSATSACATSCSTGATRSRCTGGTTLAHVGGGRTRARGMIFEFRRAHLRRGRARCGSLREWNKGKSFSQAWQDATFSHLTTTGRRPPPAVRSPKRLRTGSGTSACSSRCRLGQLVLVGLGRPSSDQVVITITVPPVTDAPLGGAAGLSIEQVPRIRWVTGSGSTVADRLRGVADPEHGHEGPSARVSSCPRTGLRGVLAGRTAMPGRSTRTRPGRSPSGRSDSGAGPLELVLDALTVAGRRHEPGRRAGRDRGRRLHRPLPSGVRRDADGARRRRSRERHARPGGHRVQRLRPDRRRGRRRGSTVGRLRGRRRRSSPGGQTLGGRTVATAAATPSWSSCRTRGTSPTASTAAQQCWSRAEEVDVPAAATSRSARSSRSFSTCAHTRSTPSACSPRSL